MPFCPRCGKAADPGDAYCKFCGAPIADGGPVRPPSPPLPRAVPLNASHPPPPDPGELTPAPAGVPAFAPRKVLGIIAVMLVIALAVFFAFSGHLLPGGTPPDASRSRDFGTGPAAGPCPADRTLCSGTCVDLQTDKENCGGCGFSVPYGETCIQGRFSGPEGGNGGGSSTAPNATSAVATAGTTVTVPAATTATVAALQTSCQSGLALCSGTCRDLTTDSRNCGSCGYVCLAGTSCQDSWCLEGAKGSNTNDSAVVYTGSACTGRETLCGTICTDLLSDKNHCGVCSRACGSQEICVNARCGPACAESGTTLCGDDCVDLSTSMSDCGSCGNECRTFLPNALGSACTDGMCVVSGCDAGYGDCDGSISNGCEANLRTDENNCGSCGTRCPSDELCSNALCKLPVTTGT
jgi:hypothetical protein